MYKSILVVSSTHLLDDVRVFQKQCLSLARFGFDVKYIGTGLNVQHNGCVETESISEVRTKYQRLLINPLIIFLKAIRTKRSVVIFHDPELIFYMYLLKIIRPNLKVVFDIHEDVQGLIINRKWIKIKNNYRTALTKIYNFIERICIKKFDGIITADDTLTSRYLSHNPKCQTIHNYPILDLSIVEDQQNAVELNCISNFGGINPGRCINEFIGAISLLKLKSNFKVIIGGDYTSDQELGRIKPLLVENNIQYLGKVDRNAMYGILRESYLSVILYSKSPNHFEVRSNRLFESLMFGVPVIVPNFGEWSAFIAKYKCGIAVDPHDINQIQDAIFILLSDDKLRLEYGQNGRKSVLENHNWKTQEELLIQFISKII